MNVNKKLGRFKQWAGERMGQEAKTSVSDDFKSLEVEMTLRHEGRIRSRSILVLSYLILTSFRHGKAPKVDDGLCKDLVETQRRGRQGEDTACDLLGFNYAQPRRRL